jgi:hypothetical protein
MTLDSKCVLDLYKIAVEEVHKYHDLHQRRVAFSSGLVSSLWAGTVAGIFKANSSLQYMLVALGPLVTLALCLVAYRGINGIYRLLMETVTTRAKFEQILGLTERPPEVILPKTQRYWEAEAFVPARHLEDRMKFSHSSKDWQEHFLHQGFKKWTNAFFVVAISVSVILFFVTVYLALSVVGQNQ